MALSIQSTSAVLTLTTTGDLYLSSSISMGAAPKGVVVMCAGSGTTSKVTHVMIGGFSLTLRESREDAAGEPGWSQIWTLDSDAFVGLLPANALLEIFRPDEGTNLHAVCLVLNSDTWAAHLISNGTSGDLTNPSVTLVAAVATWAFAALFSGQNTPASVVAGAGFTKIAGTNFPGNLISSHFERLTAQTSGGDVTAGFTAAVEDAALVASAIREIAAGPAPEPIRPFLGQASALANTLLFNTLVDQNNTPISPVNGNLVLVFAINVVPSASPPIPSLPAGWTNVISGQVIGTGDDIGYRVGRLIYNGEANIGVWTGATSVFALVYSYQLPVTVIGTVNSTTGNGVSPSLPALALTGVDGHSVVVAFAAHAASGASLMHMLNFPGTVPALGQLNQVVNRSAGGAAQIYAGGSNGYVTGFAGGAMGVPAGTANWVGIAIELLSVEPLTQEGVWRWLITEGSLPPGLTLEELTGVISGTPTEAGVFNWTYVQTDGITSSPPFPCQITIQGPLNQVGAASPDMSWSFDIGRFHAKGEDVWTRHTRVMRRPAQVERNRILYVGADPTVETPTGIPADNVVVELNKNGVIADGYWTSGTLNRKNSAAQYTITRFVFRYEAGGVAYLEIEASGNGGLTWTPCLGGGLNVTDSNGQIRRGHVGFNVTGYDLRVRIKLPEGILVRILRGRPELIERGEV